MQVVGEKAEGRVVKYHREYAWIKLETGSQAGATVIAKPRGRLELTARAEARAATEAREFERLTARQLAVGDRVELQPPPSDDRDAFWVMTAILPRETWLIRRSEGRYSRQAQLVVANADQLAVVLAPNPTLRLGTADRYFLAALQGGLKPLLIVNKVDLDPALPDSIEFEPYRQGGYQVYFTQADTQTGLAELWPALAGQLTVFCGHSGVGKSTLLSGLTGQDLKRAPVRERDGKGRQTTVTAVAYDLPGGGLVVDTPGVREFALAHLTWLDVHEYFSDIAQLTLQCSFSDCTHTVEPGCAVVAAVESGGLSAARLDSYRKLRAEAEAGVGSHWR